EIDSLKHPVRLPAPSIYPNTAITPQGRESILTATYPPSRMRTLHQYAAWVAVATSAIVGVWGLILDRRRRPPTRPFWAGVAVASTVMLAQVGLGVAMIASRELAPGDQHVFYGIVIAFVFAFAYIYRSQLSRRPALYYGLLFLFVMGLGLRNIATFGADF